MQYETPWDVSSLEQCSPYHTCEVGGNLIEAEWDLRPCIRDYTGRQDFRGKRVLDIGTASGFLSFHMERQGADVVSFDLGENRLWDCMPHWKPSMEEQKRMKRFYWYCHKHYNSKNKVFYGEIYDLPQELGHFDMVMVGSVLLHLENPYGALRNIAKLRPSTIVVVDAHRPYIPTKDMVFRPAYPSKNDWVYWWYIPWQVTERMLITLGYNVEKPYFFKAHGRKQSIELYTLVARLPE